MKLGEFGIKEQDYSMNIVSHIDDITNIQLYAGARFCNEFYVAVIKNPNTDNEKVCRISLILPRYIQYDEKLTKEELLWFNRIIRERWDEISNCFVEQAEWYNDDLLRLPNGLECLDYSNLETAD